MRLFISITPPPDIIHKLSKLQQQIQQTQLFEATYVKPENFHVTLLFVGTIIHAEFDQIKHIFSTVEYRQFSITLAQVELHQDHDNAHAVLWVTLDSPELAPLAHKFAHVFDRTSRSFVGHITLARIKKFQVPLYKAQEILTKLSIAPMSWIATSLELQESTLTSQGPIYTVHARTVLE